jgi:hypothetical protein
MKMLWVILVPTIHSDSGNPIRVRHHRRWDAKVRDITGGLTILHPAKGQWISPDGELFAERMIPVQIMCTKEEMEKIVDMTAIFYNQWAVMYYVVSQSVHIKHYVKKDGRTFKAKD